MADTRIRSRGQVKWYDARKGYGFILRDGGSKVFVHHSSIVQDGPVELKAGELVEFNSERTSCGLVAHSVVRAK